MNKTIELSVLYFVGSLKAPSGASNLSSARRSLFSDDSEGNSSQISAAGNQGLWSMGYFCNMCNVHIGKDENEFKSHTATKHNIVIYGCCDVCFRGYRSKPGFLAHMKTHDGDKSGCPKCDQCGQYFQSNSHLVIHMRKHSDDRPYSCDLCGKAYKSRSTLNMHRCIDN